MHLTTQPYGMLYQKNKQTSVLKIINFEKE